MTHAATWRLSSTDPITLRCWDDEYVFYHFSSGNTHQLTWMAAELLQKLQAGPLGHIALVQAVLAADETLDPPEVVTEVARILAQFDRLDIIERVPA